jgi:hypothetical protein
MIVNITIAKSDGCWYNILIFIYKRNWKRICFWCQFEVGFVKLLTVFQHEVIQSIPLGFHMYKNY